MTIATGEVVATPGEEWPYKVVIRHGDKQIGEVAVGSVSAGEAMIKDILGKLSEMAKDAGNA